MVSRGPWSQETHSTPAQLWVALARKVNANLVTFLFRSFEQSDQSLLPEET